jgi:hypothetical protein
MKSEDGEKVDFINAGVFLDGQVEVGNQSSW